MHPRSPYQTYIDFRQLAEDYPNLSKFFVDHKNLDFKNPTTIRELGKCLLSRDFGLTVDIPEDRLCPMVPSRVNYVLWVQDLLDSTGNVPFLQNPTQAVTGLDIGTGASCIYPLIACALRDSWRMIGTDIDHVSVCYAIQNILKNAQRLGDRIKVHEVNPSDPILSLDNLGLQSIDFMMCNPPFYSSPEEMLQSAKQKSLPPLSACTGTAGEMVYAPYGEVGFARRILAESLQLRQRITWYTILFGKLSSVTAFITDLKNLDIIGGNWAITELVQGSTKRWAVAWSFNDRRPSEAASIVKAPALKGCSPFPPEFKIKRKHNPKTTYEKIQIILSDLYSVKTSCINECNIIMGEVPGNVWSRAYRRATQKGTSIPGIRTTLGFLIQVHDDFLNIRWIKGRDSVLFESFCGMIKRQLEQS